MPLFGKKKEVIPVNKPEIHQYKEHLVHGTPTGLAFCELHGKDALVVSSLDTRGFTAMTADGEKLWSFDTGATVYSLLPAKFGTEQVIVAGSGEKVFAVSEPGTELWQYPMPSVQGKYWRGMAKLGKFMHEIDKKYGYSDVYHLATGKLEGEDVVIAVAGMEHLSEGPQILSTKGEIVCSFRKKMLWGEYGLPIQECLLDLSPRGNSVLAVVAGPTSYIKEISEIAKDGKITKKHKVYIDIARRDTVTKGGQQDKQRGKLVAGKLGATDVAVLGTPMTRSVAAVSLDGGELWNYETNRGGDINAGVNDIAIGTAGGQSVVVIGTFDHMVHLVDSKGARLDVWGYPSNVTNVACGKIKGKDAIAVGLYSGQIFTYVCEPY